MAATYSLSFNLLLIFSVAWSKAFADENFARILGSTEYVMFIQINGDLVSHNFLEYFGQFIHSFIQWVYLYP